MRFSSEIEIQGRKIGTGHRPFIIAEMSGNHNQSIERALEIVKAAKSSGAEAIKLQTYTADTMTLDLDTNEFFVSDKENIWKGQSLYQLYEKAHTPWEWHKRIFEYSNELGLICFSTPFDETAVDFLESLNVPCYKIASFENTDIPLLKKVAQTKKPIIMSTGMATFRELAISMDVLEEAGCKDVILLKCTSSYPSTEEDANLSTISHLKEAFGVNVGLSDHSMGIAVPIVATALGAVVIDKHFTLSRDDGGVDSSFSLTPLEFQAMVDGTKSGFDSLGIINYERCSKEKKSVQYRRSIYVSKDIKKGEHFSNENVRVIRPALGLEPVYLDIVLGRVAKQDLKKGTPLSWNYL